jgi:hypothetical protein
MVRDTRGSATTGNGREAADEAGARGAVTDPVLADLWDNDEDAVYDDLAAPASETRAPAYPRGRGPGALSFHQ